MRSKNKALLLVLCVVMLVSATAFGTLAYLTDVEAVTNTFTVGKVDIELDEAKVNPDGTEVPNVARVQENEYHLLPGHEYKKDPTVHVKNDSEKCYVFVKVQNDIAAIEAETVSGGYQNIAKQITDNGWIALENHGVTTENTAVYYKVWEKAASATGDYSDLEVFAEFEIKGDGVDGAKLADYAGKTVKVTAYAVQFDGFQNNVAGAWNVVKDLQPAAAGGAGSGDSNS